MPPALRVALTLSSGLLAWTLYRREAPVVLWIYFLLAAYSAAAFQPFQENWWTQLWLWAEPIRMCLRTAVVIALFREIRYFRPVIARISALVAGSFALLYRVTCGPTHLEQFMAVRTYWLIVLAVFLLTAMLCLWTIECRIPERVQCWTGVIFCYAASAVIDWRITTKRAWLDNTNIWSGALTGILTLWMIKEHLQHDQNKKHQCPAHPEW
jgi:hypothetical protein